MLGSENRADGDFAYRSLFSSHVAAGEDGKIAQVLGAESGTIDSFFGGKRVGHHWRIDRYRSRRINCNFIIGNVSHERIADAWFEFAKPIVPIAPCEDGVRRTQQHYSATTKVDVARASHFPRATDCRADLLHHMSDQASLFRIDFRDTALEADYYFGKSIRGDRLAQVDPQRRL